MPIKSYRPQTPSLRYKTGVDFSQLSKVRPERKLLLPLKKSGGRSNTGRITMRFIGGGHKRRYRIIDFKRNKLNIPGKVDSIQYDPNRSAFIALIVYRDGEKRYIIAPVGLGAG